MNGRLEVVILGCGSSGGVPRADGNWGACDPRDQRNARTRCSLMVRRRSQSGEGGEETTIIVDAAPELRLQSAAAGIKRLDGVCLTHDHADQVHGIDDIRAFFLKQKKRIPCWMDATTEAAMRRRFAYMFDGAPGPYPAIADIEGAQIGDRWRIEGPSGAIPVAVFDQDHGATRSLGYRFGPVAYSSDVVDLPEESFAALQGVGVWIVDALRFTPHPTHAHVDKTLAWIEKVRPARAILTNLHIDLDYATLAARLPAGVEPAYDGLRFEVELAGAYG
ncbi:MAG: MBL fold metallo-hydrolase [Caulobacteraceae bacterium]